MLCSVSGTELTWKINANEISSVYNDKNSLISIGKNDTRKYQDAVGDV